MGLSSLTLGRMGIQPGFFLFPVLSFSLYVCQPFFFFCLSENGFHLPPCEIFGASPSERVELYLQLQVEISWGRSVINLAFTLFPLLG